MRNKMELFSNCIAEGINCVLVFAIMTVVLRDFVQEWPGMYRLLPFLLVPVCLYLIREYCKNAVVFFVLHFAVWWGTISFLAGSTLSMKVLFGLAATIFIGVSIYRRLSEGSNALGAIHPVVMTIAIFLLYIIDTYKGGGRSGGHLLRFMLIYLVVYLLYYYFRRFVLFINMNCKMTKNVPTRRIFFTSFGLISIFILVMLAMTLLFVNKEMLDNLANLLGEWLFSLISILMRFLVRDVGMPRLEKEKMQKEKMELFVGEIAPQNEAVTAFLNALAMTLGTVVTVGLVIMLLIGFGKLVCRAFKSSRVKSITQNNFYEEKVESIKREKNGKTEGKRKNIYLGGPDMQVRKQYYKAMMSKKSLLKISGLKNFSYGTARENTMKYLDSTQDKPEASKIFYTTYEKARYGAEICDKTDVKQMKQSRDILLKK